jgi:hypothetical protein
MHDPLKTNVQRFQLLADNALRHLFAEVLYQQPQTALLRSVDRRALTMAQKALGVD